MSKAKTILILLLGLILGACQNNIKDGATVDSSTNFEDAPQWSKEVVWYQIFVETFRNGDTSNDPTKEDIAGAYPGFVPENWTITPWTHDWYKPDNYAKGLMGSKDDMGNPMVSFGQFQQLRHYGGDLQGVLDKLNYLDSLGVTAIYFNPLNDAPSSHKYDARNWRHIDRNFGPTPRKDVEIMEQEIPDDPATWKMTGADNMFLKVVEELHKRGIKVIMDYSWNHAGNTCWAFKDVVKNQEKSTYKDWFWIDRFDDPSTPENEFAYKGWAGVPSLVEIKETQYVEHTNVTHVFDGDYFSESIKQHIFNISKKWLDPNGDGNLSDGVDGFRLDVAAEIPMGFWREYRKIVRGVNPEAYLVGETWFASYPNSMLDPKPLLDGDIFDGVMNYRWYKAAREFFVGSNAILASAFVDSLTRISSNLRDQNNLAMMNVASSHDSPRLLTSLFNKNNNYKYKVAPTAEEDYKIHKPDAEAYQTARLLLAHQFTYIGAPQIWAGEEMGMWGADMGDSRKPLIWPDYKFEPEVVHPLERERPVDEVKFDRDHFRYYQKLIQIREDHPVLKTGKIKFLAVNGNSDVLAYSRFDENDEIIAVFNTNFENRVIELPVVSNDKLIDILNGIIPVKNDKGEIQLNIPARTACIFVK